MGLLHQSMPELVDNELDMLSIYRDVARIHMQCIEQGFLSKLGESFLVLLYESIAADRNSVLFIERSEGHVVGFITGGRGMGSIYRQMLLHWPRLFVALLPTMFKPLKLKWILEVILFSFKKKPTLGYSKAELLSIAVLESARGKGVATRLYRALTDHFSNEGEPAFSIVVGNSLDSAHHFYLCMGAIPVTHITVHDGQVSTLYQHDLLKNN